jgi:hypothetical protein
MLKRVGLRPAFAINQNGLFELYRLYYERTLGGYRAFTCSYIHLISSDPFET